MTGPCDVFIEGSWSDTMGHCARRRPTLSSCRWVKLVGVWLPEFSDASQRLPLDSYPTFSVRLLSCPGRTHACQGWQASGTRSRLCKCWTRHSGEPPGRPPGTSEPPTSATTKGFRSPCLSRHKKCQVSCLHSSAQTSTDKLQVSVSHKAWGFRAFKSSYFGTISGVELQQQHWEKLCTPIPAISFHDLSRHHQYHLKDPVHP